MGEPMKIPEWTLGERLAKARSDAHLTQKQMAEKIGVSPGAIAQWETDRQQPRHFGDRLQRWAEITDVDPVWLMFGYGPEARTGSFLTPVDLPPGQMEFTFASGCAPLVAVG